MVDRVYIFPQWFNVSDFWQGHLDHPPSVLPLFPPLQLIDLGSVVNTCRVCAASRVPISATDFIKFSVLSMQMPQALHPTTSCKSPAYFW